DPVDHVRRPSPGLRSRLAWGAGLFDVVLQGSVGLPEGRLGPGFLPDSMLRLAVPWQREGMIEDLVIDGGGILALGGNREAVDHVIPGEEVRADILHMRVSVRVVQIDLLAEQVRVDPGIFELVRDHASSRTDTE